MEPVGPICSAFKSTAPSPAGCPSPHCIPFLGLPPNLVPSSALDPCFPALPGFSLQSTPPPTPSPQPLSPGPHPLPSLPHLDGACPLPTPSPAIPEEKPSSFRERASLRRPPCREAVLPWEERGPANKWARLERRLPGSPSREGLRAARPALRVKCTRTLGNSQLDVILWNNNAKGRGGTH